jgi:hypothetical protein
MTAAPFDDVLSTRAGDFLTAWAHETTERARAAMYAIATVNERDDDATVTAGHALASRDERRRLRAEIDAVGRERDLHSRCLVSLAVAHGYARGASASRGGPSGASAVTT